MLKRKKMLIAMPIVVLTFLILACMAYGEAGKAGTITGDSVNMRINPDTSAKIIMQLSQDTDITILEQDQDWYKISYNDSTGWVFGQYVSVKDAPVGTGTISGSNVNVRSKPDVDAEILTRYDKGTKVTIYEYEDKWARILLEEDRYGWICIDYINLKEKTVSRGSTGKENAGTQDNKSDEESNDVKNIRQQIVAYAKKYIGVKYKYGGTTPKGFDCSGFVQYVYKHFGISIARTSSDQGNGGEKIDKKELLSGDLVFFDTNGGKNAIEHVGIYIGGGKFIHASSGKGAKCVTISPLNEGFYLSTYMRSRRYISN